MDWERVLRQAVAPVLGAYLVFLGALIASGRRRGDAPRPQPVGWPDLIRWVGATAAGGHLVFLAIVVVFYFVLGAQARSFLYEAVIEGSALSFGIAVPAFLAFSWLQGRWRRHRRGRDRPDRRPPSAS